jgi:hypothetical protein
VTANDQAPPPRPRVTYRPGWIDRIPAELKEGRRWVTWRFEWRPRKDGGGKHTKVPYQPRIVRGRHPKAEADNPATWGLFDEALAAYQADPERLDGIGREFAAEDGLVGIDFDDCLIDGELLEWAAAWLERLGPTYAEISPSGNGIKAWYRGTLPPKPGSESTGRRRGDYGSDEAGAIEVYDRGRYFALTGDLWWEDHQTIAEADPTALAALIAELDAGRGGRNVDHKREEENGQVPSAATAEAQLRRPVDPGRRAILDQIPDDELLERARRAVNGAKFAALFDHGDTAGYPSQSEAHCALLVMLAFWTGSDPDRMERLFGMSPLAEHEKWARPKRRADEIAKAILLNDGAAYDPGMTAKAKGTAAPPRPRQGAADGAGAGTAGAAGDQAKKVSLPDDHGGAGAGPPDDPGAGATPDSEPVPKRRLPILSNMGFRKSKGDDGEESVITFALNVHEIDATLRRITPGWPKRVGPTLFVPDTDNENKPRFLTSAAEFFGWLIEHAQVEWISRSAGGKHIPKTEYFNHLCATVEAYEAIEFLPHWPPMESAYYMHEPVPRKTGSELTDKLLAFFSPATEVDRELIRVFILTLFWGGPPGGRPAFMVTSDEDGGGEQLGIGKSTLVSLLTYEFVGEFLDVSPTDQIADVKTRLLSKEGRRKRVALLDNLKTLKFSWADLEGLITKPLISGKDLYVGEGQRPNTVLWAITLNGANLSRDMAQRVVGIKLKKPTFDPLWTGRVREFIRSNKQGLLGEIRVALEDEPGMIKPTRWSAWERDVLSKVTLPEQCQEAIAKRQGDVDVDAEDAREVEWFFRERIRLSGYDPDTAYLFIRSRMIAYWLELATGERWVTNRASAHIRTLGIPTLRKTAREGWPGWAWTGKDKKVRPNEKATELHTRLSQNDTEIPF